ncbi:inner nuclear membrane protein Man1-like [Lycorma delicatula]|uniref:inner nuclear membrane protein Man1-like n=1 Tax=Lycorma delicatula TaxID=130591 RepID=UPI003F519193
MASLDRLTDGELRTELSRLGYPVGPITSTTRKVLLKKLKNLLELTKSDEDGRTRKNLSRFSSGDESEDDAKLETSKRRSMPPPKKTPPVKSTRRRSSGRTSGSSQHENETVTNVSTLSNTSSNGLATSSPEKDKFSPSSFADSYFKSKASTGSLFTSLTGRRSYRSDVRNILNSDDTGSDTDVNEEALNSKLSNFVNQNRSRSDDGPARSLELSSGLSTSYIPADSFKNRFLSTKSTVGEDIGGSVIGNDGFENSYSDASRRFCRTGLQPSFTNRIGCSFTNTSLGLSNVKESDDEEPLRTSVPQSQYSSRSRSDRWTFDSPWWRSTSLVSMGLIIFFICFFALIFISYINVKWKDSYISTPDTNYPVCKGSFAKPGENCIVEHDIRAVMEIFRKIHNELHSHVVRVKCDGVSKNTALTWTQLSQLIIENNSEMSIWEIEQQYDNLKVLINANKQWGVEITRDGLDIPEPSLPFSCLIKHNVIFCAWFIIRVFVAGFVIYIVKRGINWWMYRKEEHKKEVFKLVEAIIDLLSTHSQNCGDRDTFLAVDHVRDQLIPPHRRYSMAKLWDDAVSYLESKESRVRSEIQQVAGEECRVWRWLPTNSRRKIWQGQAFETQEGSVNSLNVSPTPCLKIRHMFDPDVEVGEEWVTHVKDAILEKCEGINVLHIAIDKGSLEGCVYLKCSSPEEAGKAYRALHGSWFDSKLVTVKYLRLERYHERFPDAARRNRPLRPSNNDKMSLQ